MSDTPSPSPFAPDLPAFQLSWDSTSLGWFKKCAQLYKYQMIDQWTPKSKGIHLYFGGLYASGVEHYAHHRANGLDHNTAVREMVKWVMRESGERFVGISDEGGVTLVEWRKANPSQPDRNPPRLHAW